VPSCVFVITNLQSHDSSTVKSPHSTSEVYKQHGRLYIPVVVTTYNQKMVALRFFALGVFITCDFVAGQGLKSQVTLTYEYQLEIFPSIEESSTALTGNDYLNRIDISLMDGLPEMLANDEEESNSNSQVPSVEFVDISSEIYSACFTSADECSLVRSRLVIAYEGEKPKYSVERVATRLVQDFLRNYNETTQEVTATYEYPFWMESNAEFEIQPVDSIMTGIEIGVMEEAILEVFGAVMFAMEGDTDMIDSKFTYQHLLESINTSTNTSSNDQRNFRRMLNVDFEIVGLCRECSEEGFSGLVQDVVTGNVGAFRDKLQVNGRNMNSTYFDKVDRIVFAFPLLPDDLPPVEDNAIYDLQPPQSNSSNPWYLYFGITASICILLFGMYVVYKDHSDFRKEKDEDMFSTESESNISSHFEVEETNIIQEYQLEGGGSKDAIDKNTSLEEYQVETILSYSEEHTDGDYTNASVTSASKSNERLYSEFRYDLPTSRDETSYS
jgi:hypothetical protein